MTEDTDTWTLRVELPQEWKEVADRQLDYGERKQIVRDAIQERLFGDAVTRKERLQKQRERIQEERSLKRRQRDSLNEELEELADHERGIEERISHLEDRRQDFRDRVESVADQRDVIAYDHSEIFRMVESYDKSAEEIRNALREEGVEVLTEEELGVHGDSRRSIENEM